MPIDNKVTIITPTFNREKFIGKAIESVMAQTYKNFEMIIVDDGSTDGTRELIGEYIKKDSRIKYFFQENKRASAARNLALSHASGDFIAFLDSDNYWPDFRLERTVQELVHNPDVDIVYGDIITINEGGDEVGRHNMPRYSGYIADKMLKDNFVSMNTTLVRRRCFDEMGGMSGKRPVADDYDLWLRFSARYKYLYIPEYLAYYRVMPDQISSDKRKRFTVNESILLDFLAEYPGAVDSKKKSEGLSSFYCRKARYYSSLGELESFRSWAKAFSYRPFSLNVWRCFVKILMNYAKIF